MVQEDKKLEETNPCKGCYVCYFGGCNECEFECRRNTYDDEEE